jgi:hypothetical protein
MLYALESRKHVGNARLRTREKPAVDDNALSEVLRPRLREKGGALCPKGVIIVTDKHTAYECSRRTSHLSGAAREKTDTTPPR